MVQDSGLRDADLVGVRGQIKGMQVAREDDVVGQPAQTSLQASSMSESRICPFA